MSLVAQMVKNLPAMQETRVRLLGREDHLEKGKLTYSGSLALRIPCTEESCGLQSMGSQSVDHDFAVSTHTARHTAHGPTSSNLFHGIFSMLL